MLLVIQRLYVVKKNVGAGNYLFDRPVRNASACIDGNAYPRRFYSRRTLRNKVGLEKRLSSREGYAASVRIEIGVGDKLFYKLIRTARSSEHTACSGRAYLCRNSRIGDARAAFAADAFFFVKRGGGIGRYSLGILTPYAAERTSLEKGGRAYPGTVMQGASLNIENISDNSHQKNLASVSFFITSSQSL